jgi:hypothetical protein
MKMFQINFSNIFFILLILSLIIVLPSFIIQVLWNSIYATNLERDMSIQVWQAALLWGAFLALLYMTGVVRFKIDLKTLESIDLDNIADPELRDEIEKLKIQAKKAQEEKKKKEQEKSWGF